MRFECRAKVDGIDKWTYGSYYKFLPYTPYPVGGKILEKDYKHLIIHAGFSDWGLPRNLAYEEILPETLCYSTGLKSNKLEIYEHDLLEIPEFWEGDFRYPDGLYEVKWDTTGFILEHTKTHDYISDWETIASDCEIVGNIFDKNK